MTTQPLDDPFYYLNNFQQVLDWLAARYADLLDVQEQAFIDDFSRLPKASRALLVRMVMRKGGHFRAGKLNYAEIGDPEQAALPLLTLGWVRDDAPLSLAQLFTVLQKAEVLSSFKADITQPRANKPELYAELALCFDESRSFAQWCPSIPEPLYSLQVMPLCDRLRLMFFGNLYQDWSEFVLADLGIFTYEKVELHASSRGLRSRADLDGYLHLQAAREALEAGERRVLGGRLALLDHMENLIDEAIETQQTLKLKQLRTRTNEAFRRLTGQPGIRNHFVFLTEKDWLDKLCQLT